MLLLKLRKDKFESEERVILEITRNDFSKFCTVEKMLFGLRAMKVHGCLKTDKPMGGHGQRKWENSDAMARSIIFHSFTKGCKTGNDMLESLK